MKELLCISVCPKVEDKELQKATDSLYKALLDYRNAAARAAYIAGDIDTRKLYEKAGCKSAAEFIMQTFGVNKTMAYSMVKVGKRFMKSLNESNLPHDSGKDFNFTQLEKMLPVSDDNRDKLVEVIESGAINPDMSAREISSVVAGLKGKKASKDEPSADGETPTIHVEVTNEEVSLHMCSLMDIPTNHFSIKDTGENLEDWLTDNNVSRCNTAVKVLPEDVIYIYIDRLRKNGKIYADVIVAWKNP